jgi:hypothetical protein
MSFFQMHNNKGVTVVVSAQTTPGLLSTAAFLAMFSMKRHLGRHGRCEAVSVTGFASPLVPKLANETSSLTRARMPSASKVGFGT